MKWPDAPVHIAREENSIVYVYSEHFMLDK
jgi:hypothetical protein